MYVALVASNVKTYPPSEKALSKIVAILLQTVGEEAEEPSSLGVIYSAFVTIDQVMTNAIYSKSKKAIVGAATEVVCLFPLLGRAAAVLRNTQQQETRTQTWTESLSLLTCILSKVNIFAVESTHLVKQLMASGLFRSLVDIWCNESHVNGSQCMESVTLVLLKLCTSSSELCKYVSRVPLVQTKIAAADYGTDQEHNSMSMKQYLLLLRAAGCFKASTNDTLCQHIREEENLMHLAELLSLMNDVSAEKPYSKIRFSFDERVLKSVEETRQKLRNKFVPQEDVDEGEDYVDHESKERKFQVLLQRCLKECKVLLHDGTKKVE
jgi:hypothetical protein